MSDDQPILDAIMQGPLQERFEQEVLAAHREKILEIFGVTQEEVDALGGGSYRAAKAQAEQDLADWLAWAKGVRERLLEPMDPHCDRLKIIGYLNGKVEWDALNSPEQAQVMDWRHR